jgi:ankyrin repeat protein
VEKYGKMWKNIVYVCNIQYFMDSSVKLWRLVDKQNRVKQIDQDLLNAAYFGNTRNVKKYIALGGNINYMEDRDGWLGIHYAARWGLDDMLLAYIKAGCDVNAKTKNKETSLHKCGRWDTKSCAIILLERGARPDIKNSDGNIASDFTSDPEMKFLLDNYEEYKKIKQSLPDTIREPSQKIVSPVRKYIRTKCHNMDYHV